MSDENKHIVKKAFDAINRGDAANLTASVDPKLHKSFETAFHAARSGFKDMKLEILDLIAEGDKVVARWAMQGTHTGEAPYAHLGTVKATHKPVRVSGITILQISRGKVINTWGETGELGGLLQLGLMDQYAKAVHHVR
jgi:predicted ester cyclase